MRPDFTPEDLLAGLFPISPSPPPAPPAPPSSFPVTSPLGLTAVGKRPRQNSQPGRSSSYTRGAHLLPERLSHLLPPDAQLHGSGKLRLSVAATATGTDDERGSVRALRPLSGRGYVPPDHTSHHNHEHHPPNWQLPSSNAQLSHAVVITGLESASAAVQETLWDVLRTRTVVLEQEGGGAGNVWNLPDGFILVYVASLGDGSSRPAIQSALVRSPRRLHSVAKPLTTTNFLSARQIRIQCKRCSPHSGTHAWIGPPTFSHPATRSASQSRIPREPPTAHPTLLATA